MTFSFCSIKLVGIIYSVCREEDVEKKRGGGTFVYFKLKRKGEKWEGCTVFTKHRETLFYEHKEQLFSIHKKFLF
jgi:hypothetical protein